MRQFSSACNALKIEELKHICESSAILLSKERGQNFLFDGNMLACLADITASNPSDCVVEVGAGVGNWTEHLARRAKKVYAIEVDRKLYSILEQRMGVYPNVRPMHADVLRFDFEEFFAEHAREHFVVAGNLPFSLSSPLLFQWVELYRKSPRALFERACFMVQREVAQRMMAEVGTPRYGRLTVMLAYYAEVNLERQVPRQCFFPTPKVDSSFVSLRFGAGVRQRPQEDELFEQVVRRAFNQRRKQLRNALATLQPRLNLAPNQWERVFERAGVNGALRAGAVAPEGFRSLTRTILEYT